MKDGKIVVARLWSRYGGHIFSRTPVILGIDPQKYQTICIYLMKNSQKPNFLEQQGCKTFYLSKKKFLHLFNLPIIWKLSRILKRQNVDILHCHRHKATVYGTIAAKITGVPVIFSHVHGMQRSKNLKRKFINWIILRWVNKIITVGQAVRQDVLASNFAVRPEQVVSLGNSIYYNRFADVQITSEQAKQGIGLKPDCFVFGTIGRLAPTKGHIHLIRAFAGVKQHIPSAHLVLVGDGRLRSHLEAQAAKIAHNSIHFLGHRNDVPELLRAMDVYVQPSIGSEGLPRALLEAMAAGVPCIGTEVGGIPEIFDNGKFGFLVPPRDDKALEEMIFKLTKVPHQQYQELIEGAKQRVLQQYNHGKVIEKLQSLYEAAYAESQRANSHL